MMKHNLSAAAPTTTTMNVSSESQVSNRTADPLGGHKLWEVVLIILITGPLSLVTIIGNLLVIISFRVNSNLRTVNNYFLLSLAVADLVLGAISMNLYTVYIIMGRWALGNLACDIWLAIDYVASNASVMNLLVISFDRFFSITRPLTYRTKRTPRRAAVMISLAWVISFILWAPAILLWPHIVEEQTVEKDKCNIQFLTEPVLTFGTAIAAFYLPVSIMIILYWRIYREIKNRTRDLAGLVGLADGGEVSLSSRQQARYSISSSKEKQAGESHARERRPSFFPITLSRKKEALASSFHHSIATEGSNNNGGWNMDEEEASDSSFSEAKGMSVMVVPLPMVHLRDMQGIVPGLEDRGVPMAGDSGSPRMARPPKAKKRQNTIVKEKKAAKTLSAILLAFILTWTPYNIMVLVSIFKSVPEKLWQLGYWLCYVNSTVNPVCYALCNKSFRVTFKMLLLLRWDKRKWGKPHHRATPRAHRSSSTV